MAFEVPFSFFLIFGFSFNVFTQLSKYDNNSFKLCPSQVYLHLNKNQSFFWYPG